MIVAIVAWVLAVLLAAGIGLGWVPTGAWGIVGGVLCVAVAWTIGSAP